MGATTYVREGKRSRGTEKKYVRAADAKEVGVGNPAEETYRYPNTRSLLPSRAFCQQVLYAEIEKVHGQTMPGIGNTRPAQPPNAG